MTVEKIPPKSHSNLWMFIIGICVVLILLSGKDMPEGSARPVDNDVSVLDLIAPKDPNTANLLFYSIGPRSKPIQD